MRRKADWLWKRIAVSIIKPSNAGSQDLGSDESSDSSSHVHNTRSSKVMHSAAKERVGIEGCKKSGRRPNGVDDYRVDKSREHETVSQIGLELASFSNSTSN